MTLEEKATDYCNKMMCTVCSNIRCGYKRKCTKWEIRKIYYLAGAKENGIVWHNLKENPDDLPKDHYIKQIYNHFDGYARAWYNEKEDECISENSLKHYHGTIEQWCELPTL